MLNELFLNKTVNIYKLLTIYYQNLNLNLEEYCVLMQLFLKEEAGENVLKIEKLANKVGLSSVNVSEIVNNLLVKGFMQIQIDYKKNGKKGEVFTLEPCLKKIEEVMLNKFVSYDVGFLQKVNSKIEEILGRSLSANEYEVLKTWEEKDEEIILKSIDEAKKNNIKNIKYIDQLVISSKKAKDNNSEKIDSELYRNLEEMRNAIKR